MNIQFYLTVLFISLLIYSIYIKDRKKKDINSNIDKIYKSKQENDKRVVVTSVEDLEPKNQTINKVKKANEKEEYTYVKTS